MLIVMRVTRTTIYKVYIYTIYIHTYIPYMYICFIYVYVYMFYIHVYVCLSAFFNLFIVWVFFVKKHKSLRKLTMVREGHVGVGLGGTFARQCRAGHEGSNSQGSPPSESTVHCCCCWTFRAISFKTV